MRGADRWALAARRPCGEIFVDVNPVLTLARKHPRWNRFPIRGMFALADSLIIGVKALSISGGISLEDVVESEADEPVVRESCDGKIKGERAAPVSTPQIAIALVIAFGLFFGLFVVLPAALAHQFDGVIDNTVVYNLIEGGIRITIFVLYLAAMSLIPDIRRVFMYHGAEHKAVHAYESGAPMTVESAAKFSRAHVRCGTAFVLIVFVVSILAFSLMGRPALALRVLERLVVIPFVAGFSYEIIKFAGKREDSRATKVLMAPGLLLQKLTTREPDEAQLEVAILALEAAIGSAPDVAVAVKV
ncbi:MAG: DUF1385 domain-containing protein [Candidatus Anoxymicrobium japonicum]|uniref:DUF1385 domain-containing protein n=1 Tax=Candidatus Anoxymicrobium japonicum TaxID=2013648 RepID=A0A2N3G562_9ACTN|nr:MAG: DUF1385 domain-containing protein [Candidatus Anoxymicrobium japonicum]